MQNSLLLNLTKPAVGLLTCFFSLAGEAILAQRSTTEQTQAVVWHDVQQWGIEGKGWSATEGFFDRFPSYAKAKVPLPVWNLSLQSAGLSVRFETNAQEIWVRYSLRSKQMALPHMPATGVSGIDLYADDVDGQLRWLACTKPVKQTDSVKLITGLSATKNRYVAYLPLYNGLKSLEIGVPKNDAIEFAGIPPRQSRPIVFYGTSITQGACASRPGMAYPALLGRRLGVPTLNLGFSGNGKMELAVAEVLGEIDASLFVVDCLPNMTADLVSERAIPFLRKLHELRPKTPILLVEDRTYSNSWAIESKRKRHESARSALRTAVAELQDLPPGLLILAKGDEILGPDSTTDGSHPSDLGFVEYANYLEPLIRSACNACPAEAE